MSKGPISQFIEKHYLHFNSASLVDAAKAWAAANMTSLFKKRSDSWKAVLLCSHGDKYRSSKKQEADQKRNSSTIKTNCQF